MSLTSIMSSLPEMGWNWKSHVSVEVLQTFSPCTCLVLCCAMSLQLCLTLCDPTDCGLPGSYIRQILQARTGKNYSRDLPDAGIERSSLTSPALAGGFFITCTATWEAQKVNNWLVTKCLGTLSRMLILDVHLFWLFVCF